MLINREQSQPNEDSLLGHLRFHFYPKRKSPALRRDLWFALICFAARSLREPWLKPWPAKPRPFKARPDDRAGGASAWAPRSFDTPQTTRSLRMTDRAKYIGFGHRGRKTCAELRSVPADCVEGPIPTYGPHSTLLRSRSGYAQGGLSRRLRRRSG